MYIYSAFGLGIHSVIPLPELLTLAGGKADVVIRIEKMDRPLPKTRQTEDCFHFTEDEAYFYWDQVGAFFVRGGKEIIVDPFPGADERLIRLPLLGAVMAVLLHQRGLMVLHASAIAINGDALVFMGAKGQGKSTTAAALYARGHSLMADDTVALDLSDPANPRVFPGFPQFKLWPEAVACSLGEDPEILPRLISRIDKRARRVREGFLRNPAPLRCIFTLSEGPAPRLEILQPQEALLQLIGHSYVARFGKRLLRGERASLHFQHCANLVNKVPVYRLHRPSLLEVLFATARLVEDQFRIAQEIPTGAL